MQILSQLPEVLMALQERSERREVESLIPLTQVLRTGVVDQHVLFILHLLSVAPVAQLLLPVDAAPLPRFHLQVVINEAEAADRHPQVVGDVAARGIQRVHAEAGVHLRGLVNNLRSRLFSCNFSCHIHQL